MPVRTPIPVGSTFDRLTVIGYADPFSVDGPKRKRTIYRCIAQCSCGNIVTIHDERIKNGNTKSCGCLFDERVRSGDSRRTHGMSKTPTYESWKAMLARCRNEKNPNYPNYGGRGISVCNEWDYFDNFFRDMGERPNGMSIERLDNNSGYRKENCKWATRDEQNSNTRRNVHVILDGEKMSMRRAMITLGFSPATIYDRMESRNCSYQEAIDYYASIRKDRPHD